MKKLIFSVSIILTLAMIYPSRLYATCTFLNGAKTGDLSVNFPEVIIQKNTPVGTVLASITLDVAAHTNAIGLADNTLSFLHCYSENGLRWGDSNFKTIMYNGVEMLDSGVEGVAINIHPYSGDSRLQWKFPPEYNTRIPAGFNIGAINYGGVTFELIKIKSNTGSGMISGGDLVRASVTNKFYLFNYRLVPSRIITDSCTVNTNSVIVNLGDIGRREFNGIGSTAAEKEFIISLDCDKNARVNISINGEVDPSLNDQTVLSLANYGNSSVASGIGIQILRDNNPIELNRTMLLKVAGGGYEYFILKARYYQTKNTITSGKANSSVTFSITYD